MMNGYVGGVLTTCLLLWLMVTYAEVDLLTFLCGWSIGVLLGRFILRGADDSR